MVVGEIPLQVSKFEVTVEVFFDCIPYSFMDFVCFKNTVRNWYAACKSNIVNIVPSL